MNKAKYFSIGFLLASYAASPVWALDIADVPLFQSTTVSPNVMLLIDDSGSMRHIIWEEDYDNNYNYFLNGGAGAVEYHDSSNWADLSLEEGTYITKDNMKRDSCSTGYDHFRIDGVATKCIKFPDPVGSGETWFVQNYVAYLVRKYSDGTDLTVLPVVPNDYRMNVAKAVSKSVIANNSGMRFGVFSFKGQVGGELEAAVGSSQSILNSSIDGLGASTSTPLAEAYYEVSRYFRGMAKGSEQTGTYTSPIQYRCQKNFGIVITDGLPTYDTTFPTDDPEDVSDSARALPDWDGLSPTTNTLTPSPQYSDGYRPWWSGEWSEGYSLYLDDIAKFAYDIDLKASGSDEAHVSYNDPDFIKQNLQTYTVGFAQANQMLEDAADYGRGQYFTANNSSQLSAALSSALQSIKEATSSAAAIATNSTRLDTDTLIYQARFNSSDWSGELIAFGINPNGSVGSESWATSDTGLIPSSAARNIYTYNGAAGASFTWNSLTTAQQTDLAVANAGDGALVVDWLRGGSSGATLSSGEVLRSRAAVLGDIVNSDPVFVGAQNFGYTVPNDPLVTTEPADSYQAYLDAKSAAGATKMVMVGANDGMLHAFNAQNGRELFAYVPSTLFKPRSITPGATPGLRELSKSDYAHKFYVDGAIGIGDVFVGSAWKTYAVGGLSAGGRGVYALNITNPASLSASDVLWEITAPDTNDTANAWNDLGYTYGLPVIARTQNDTWVAIFGNGYDSNTGRAALYVVNASTGALIKRIYAGSDTGNGLSAPAVIVDADRRVTTVFAGDLKGNLWKFDLDDTSSSNWEVAYSSGSGNSATDAPLFTARNAANQVQPITSGLEIGGHPNGGLVVYFGTGKYFESTDNVVGNNPEKQSFYGIWDRPCLTGNCSNNSGGPITSTDRSLLVRQTITSEAGGNRVVSQNTIDWTNKRGWYLDLVPPTPAAAQGERVVSLPLLRAGRIIFATVIPSLDPCLSGGSSWLMELDASTGGRLNFTVLDINGDGEFNSLDMVVCGEGTCDVSGSRSDEGIIKTPGIVSAGDTEYKYAGGSSGSILVITEKGSLKEGRMSWRQLR